MRNRPAPSLRPRQRPFIALTVLAFFHLLVFIGILLFRATSDSLLGTPLFPFLIFVIMPFLVGAQAHAYWGGPLDLGVVAAPFQLWRQPELRSLPELPPLPAWKIALCYLFPLLLAVFPLLFLPTEAIYSTVSELRPSNRVKMVLNQERSMGWVGLIRVDCSEIPGATAESVCFVWPKEHAPGMRPPPFDEVTTEWIKRSLAWMDYRAANFRDGYRQLPVPKLPFEQVGGSTSLDAQVQLPVNNPRGGPPQLGPYRLRGLSLGKAGTVPLPWRDDAAWLARQPFTAYLIVAPQ